MMSNVRFRDLMKFGPPLTTENRDRLKCQLKQISYGYIYTYDTQNNFG